MTLDVLVLNQSVHGMPAEEYAAAIRNRLPDATVTLAASRAEAIEAAPTADVVTGVDLPSAVLEAATDLDFFACLYAGTDHLPTDALAARGVAVTNAAGVHGPPVAEQVVGSLLLFARRLDEGLRRTQRGEWRHYQPGELAGSTAVVVGLGHIGEHVADRLAAFDVETVGVRHTPEKGGPVDEVVGYDEFERVVSRADALVLTCPLTDRTEGLVDADALAALPPSAVLVNVARGPVVETEALVDALRSGEVGAAALDVTDPEPLPEDHPLWTLSNCLVTPHNAGSTPAYYERRADILADNAERLADGAELTNRVA